MGDHDDAKNKPADAAPVPAPSPEPEPDHDVVLVHSPTKDGRGLRALRSRPGRLDMAEIRPVRPGQPLSKGEVVQLKKRQDSPALWDVDVQHTAEEVASWIGDGHAGPPQVTSQRFRDNWDEVFTADQERDEEPMATPGEPVTPPTLDLYRHNWERIFAPAQTDDEDPEQKAIDLLCDPRRRTVN